ncbi:MAG TPA: hypothetical protein VEN79_04460 [Terriglobia bacterium]|nr:hypothetical protein [Terriglobia bacterium]
MISDEGAVERYAHADHIGAGKLNQNPDATTVVCSLPGGSASPFAQSLEVNKAGAVVYGIQFGSIEYRSFRMQDLCTAP